jgi:ABC-2 type transport system permease protein
MAVMSEVRAAGTIYDLGYQQYTGPRLGRWNAVRNLIRFSFSTAFGRGRGEKAKVLPALVTTAVFLPALIQVAAASAAGRPQLVDYPRQLDFTSLLLALFVAVQAPELLVTDRQRRVLALYLSRPLTATDYALSKLAALAAALLVLTLGPQLLMVGGKILLSPAPWTAFKAEYTVLWPITAGAVMISLYFAAIGAGASSLTGKRAHGTAAVIALFLFLPVMAESARRMATGNFRRFAMLADPMRTITGFSNWLFDVQSRRRVVVTRLDVPPSAYLWMMIAVSIIGVSLVVWRYRRESA